MRKALRLSCKGVFSSKKSKFTHFYKMPTSFSGVGSAEGNTIEEISNFFSEDY